MPSKYIETAKGQKNKKITKKMKTLKEILLENKEGATLDFDYRPQHFENGFAVSLTDNKIIDWFNWSDEEIKKEAEKIKNLASLLNIDKAFLGWWSDEEVGYLDLTLVIENKEDALRLGKLFNQKAVYDFRTGKVIDIK